MALFESISREWTLISGLRRTLKAFADLNRESPTTIGDEIERVADRFADRTAFEFEGQAMSYAQFDALTNRYAHWGRAEGLMAGDTVALFRNNCPDFVAAWMGLAKIGVATALINTSLTGKALTHSIEISMAKQILIGADLAPAFQDIAAQLQSAPGVWISGGPAQGAHDLDARLAMMPSQRLARTIARPDLRGGAVALLVYTSGTTGLPKAAKMAHWRCLGMMRAFAAAARARAEDRVYVTLPLYHATGGLCGIGFALTSGGTVLLRQKFSASHFWPEIAAQKASVFFYIGELCRYLLNLPAHPDESRHTLRLAVGNGLRPEVWERFQPRFKLAQIMEFYGSTEGNVSMMNFDGRIGAIGRVPAYLRSKINIRLVRFDFDAEMPIRGPDGLCQAALPGETGEAIGLIREDEARYRFEGYAGDREQTNKKILRDVFAKGDAWFRTGDLMRQDKAGYFYFVDRVGDTFRWKGENVATHQVAEVLGVVAGVRDVNVYGVRVGEMDGRAGMAALTLAADADLAALHAIVTRELPPFARPVFLRVQPEIEITGTFKHRKMDLVKAGFDPSAIADPIYFDDPRTGTYARVTPEVFADIEAGRIRL